MLMTSESHQDAAKCNADSFSYELYAHLEGLLGEERMHALYLHMQAVKIGFYLKLVEQAALHPDLAPEELFVVLREYLERHPDYLPTGVLPMSSSDGIEVLPGNEGHRQAKKALADALNARLPQQFPELNALIKGQINVQNPLRAILGMTDASADPA